MNFYKNKKALLETRLFFEYVIELTTLAPQAPRDRSSKNRFAPRFFILDSTFIASALEFNATVQITFQGIPF